MKRHYNTVSSADDVIYFVGPEVEKTLMYGQPTLFKVGERPYEEILDMVKKAEDLTNQTISHIYFTANQSFNSIEDWNTVDKLLADGFYVTIDGPLKGICENLNRFQTDNEKLIMMLSIELPNISDLHSKNTYLKLDDVTFYYSNSGVWVNNFSKLLDENNFTSWEEYKQDLILARKKDL